MTRSSLGKPSASPILQSPGGLNQMMEDIVNNAEITRKYNTTVISSDPWVLQFDNFATRADWEWLATELDDKFEGSTVVGEMDENGVVARQTLQTRTSSNAWCNEDACYKSAVHRGLQHRLSRLTSSIPLSEYSAPAPVTRHQPNSASVVFRKRAMTGWVSNVLPQM